MVKVWFTRSNGETAHNEPGTPNYVQGEPPTFPERSFDYRKKCLEEGFARVGWPNAGDLRRPGEGRLAPEGYTIDTMRRTHAKRYLQAFAEIQVGDVVVIPAGAARYRVHVGVVVRRSGEGRKSIALSPGGAAYYFHHDVAHGEPYECAHRVDVQWAHDPASGWSVFTFQQLGGLWPKAFGSVLAARGAILTAANQAGLPVQLF
ncbi:MAG: hypothetical protein IT452_13745 [Planctomycetia bacterium]|nr:hypothetical protein [Planctomycetia bacterium]